MNTLEEVKKEAEIIVKIYEAIAPLNERARTRVLDWLVAKLEEDRDPVKVR